jgi:hypothetical protein
MIIKGRIRQAERKASTRDASWGAAVNDAAIASLSDEDLDAIILVKEARAGKLSSYDRERLPAARKRAPAAKRKLEALRTRYAACRTIRQAKAIYRECRGCEPDYRVTAALEALVQGGSR